MSSSELCIVVLSADSFVDVSRHHCVHSATSQTPCPNVQVLLQLVVRLPTNSGRPDALTMLARQHVRYIYQIVSYLRHTAMLNVVFAV